MHPTASPAPAQPDPGHGFSAGQLAQHDFKAGTQAILTNIERVIEGKSEAVRLALAVLLAEGHLLLEDVPGVGKTKLAKALAQSLDCSMHRIQFTPDLLPSDVTGVTVFDPETREFRFKPGAVFSNLVVGDEINRASPKTQAALLECMEERQVTVDGTTYKMPPPFMVVATQNPVEMEGTYPLPEAQRDRFTARVALGYPDPEAELLMMEHHGQSDPLSTLQSVCDAAMVNEMIAYTRSVHIADAVKRYALDIVGGTRKHASVRLGASPRASLQLLRCARAVAALDGREFVLPDDIQYLAGPVLAHRLILTTESSIGGRDATRIVAEVVSHTPVRHPDRG